MVSKKVKNEFTKTADFFDVSAVLFGLGFCLIFGYLGISSIDNLDIERDLRLNYTDNREIQSITYGDYNSRERLEVIRDNRYVKASMVLEGLSDEALIWKARYTNWNITNSTSYSDEYQALEQLRDLEAGDFINIGYWESSYPGASASVVSMYYSNGEPIYSEEQYKSKMRNGTLVSLGISLLSFLFFMTWIFIKISRARDTIETESEKN